MRKLIRKSSAAVILLLTFLLISPIGAEAAAKKKFTVIIDAGHGGNDHGAIENGVNEKDVNLAVALKLGELISKKLKDTEVVYTRSTDQFISLQKRADIANGAKGDLFISIHCNSVDKSNKNRSNIVGATTYVLGHHKDADNLAVAQRENAVVELDANDAAHYSQFDPDKDESHIIFEMTQKKNFQNSIRFASTVQKEMANTGRFSRGVQQAGFWVLWSTAMPAALVELDFICNPEQAKFLNSSQGQEKLAEAIFNAVKNYESYFRKSLGSASASNDSSGVFAEESDIRETSPTDKSQPINEAIEIAELSSATSRTKSTSRRQTSSSRKAASSSSHRRRPKAGKEAGTSNVQEAEIAIIEEGSGATVTTREVAQTAPKSSKGKTSAKATETSGGKKDKTSAQSRKPGRRDQNKGGKATRQNVHIVYKILLFTSGEELKANDEAFKGLSPVGSFRENNMYKYTYGESAVKSEMENKLREIKYLFPEAYVIRIFN